MKFIGLDIAMTTGWAFQAENFNGNIEAPWERGTTRADSQQKHDILAHAKEHGVTHACVEKPIAFAGSHAHVVVSMATSYGRWLEALDMAGIIVVPCLVSQWQNAMLVVSGKKLRQNDKKEASILVAGVLGCTTTNGDVADAVCLASYGKIAMVKNAEAEMIKTASRKQKAKLRHEEKKRFK